VSSEQCVLPSAIQRLKSLNCANWSLALKEEQRLRLFENGVLRGIRKSKREELKGGSRKLPSEEHRGLCSSVYIINLLTPELFF